MKRVVGNSAQELMQRVAEIRADNSVAAIEVTVPANLDEDETIALCSTLAALGVFNIRGADATIVRRCVDTARAVSSAELGAIQP